MNFMQRVAKRGRVPSIMVGLLLVLGTVGLSTTSASANALAPHWWLQWGSSTMEAGAVDHLDYIAETDPAGGYANQPVTVAVTLASTVTVTATPTGTNWDCDATVVGSSSFSCVDDLSSSVAPGTMLPLIWVWVQFADNYSGNWTCTTTLSASDASAPTVLEWTETTEPSAHPVSLTTSVGQGVTQTVPTPAGTGPFSYALGTALSSSWGSLSINSSTGALTYSPAAGVSGVTTTAAYTVTDASGNVSSQYSALDALGQTTNPGSITLTVQPTISAAAGSSTGPSPVVVDLPTPTGSGPFSYVMATSPPSSDGSTSIIHNTGQVTFTPALGFTGTASGTYTVTDATGATSAPAAVSFTVYEPSGPSGGNETATATATQGLVIALPQNGAAPLTYALSSTPPASQGTASVNSSTGNVTFTAANYSGSVSPFGYTITDQYGQIASGTINITVLPLIEATGGSQIAPTAITLNVDSMSPPKGTGPFHWYLSSLPPSADAGASINATTGVITVTPAVGFSGTVPSFDYYVIDASGDQSAAVAVTAVFSKPSAPVANGKEYSVYAGSSVSEYASSGFQTGDTGVRPFSTEVTSGPSHGTLSYASDGSFVYTPTAGFSGSDYVYYREYDTYGQVSGTGSVWFEVDPVAYTVTASSTAPGAVVTGIPTPLGTGPFTCSLVGQMPPTSQGTVSLNSSTCTFTFTPAAGFAGYVQSFQYSVSGQGGMGSESVPVDLRVLAPVAPVATIKSFTVAAGADVTVPAADGLQVGDSGTGSLASAVVTGPNHGTVSVSSSGGFTYWASASYSGPVSFTYADTDAWGQVSNSATVTITVTPVVQAMTAITVAGHVVHLTPSTPAGAGPFIFALDSLPPSSDGQATINSTTGVVTFTPAAGFTGTVPSFAYEVIDGHGDTSAAAAINIHVSLPGAPVSNDQSVTTSAGSTLTVPASTGLLATATGTPPLTASLTQAAADGTAVVHADGSYSYTPNPGFSGADSFLYAVSDGYGQTSSASTVTIQVTPSASAVSGTGSTGTTTMTLPAPILTGTGPFTCALTSTPSVSSGTASIDPTTCAVSFTPAPGFSGPVPAFHYTVTDATGNSTAALVTLTIRPTAAPFTATATNPGGTATTLQLPAPQGTGPFSFEMVAGTASDPEYGTISLTTTGQLTLTPPAGFSGPIPSFPYQVVDASGTLSLPATITVTVPATGSVPPKADASAGGGSTTLPSAASPTAASPTAAAVSAGSSTEPLEGGALAPTANPGNIVMNPGPAGGALVSASAPSSGFPTAPVGGLLIVLWLGLFFVWVRRRRGRTEA